MVDHETERQLLGLFADVPEELPANGFRAGVEQRIGRIRRFRLIWRILVLSFLLVVALAVSPFVGSSAGYVAESSILLSAAVGELMTLPVALVVGLVIATFALLQLRDPTDR